MPAKGSRPKWKNEFYVRIYQLASQGFRDTQIASALGVSRTRFRHWRDEDQAVKLALRDARKKPERNKETGVLTLDDFVYGHLPSDLRPLWKEITAADEVDLEPEERIARLTAGCGRRAKQHLWVHALIASHFNKNEACRKTGISKSTVDKWISGDDLFRKLVNQIPEMKKDFVEGALFGLISQGDANATIFAAKTLLRDRGYDPKVTITHEGHVNHAHGHFDMDKVLANMDVESQRKFLKAVRVAKENATPKALPPRQVVAEDA